MPDFGNIGNIKNVLETKILDLNAEDILHYPELFDEKK